ncbi:MAG: amidohydrolase family protein [Vicinamibacterales bacterium]
MRRIVVALVLCGGLLVSGCSAPPAQEGPAPDMVIVNARVYTVDAAFSTAEAVAITAGSFTAVGKNDEVRALAGPSTRVIDAGGRTIIPGLMDNHLHNAGGGPGVDLSRARSMDDVLAAIAERVKTTDPGDVVVTNADWHEAQLKEQRLPYRADLDTVAPNTAVVVVRGGHEYILNTAALRKWNITKATPQPAGGRISRDEKGELNGELVDRAKALVTLPPDDNRMNAEYFIAEHRKLNAAGLTSIRYPGAPAAQYRILQQLEKEGKLTIRVNQLMRAQQSVTLDQMKASIASWNLKQDEGNEWLRVGGVKMGVDGGFEGGWMSELYEKPFDEGGKYYGINTLKQEPYTEIVKELNRQGWRVSTHAVGDAAIDEVLAGYEAADAEKSIAGRRWTIEHGFVPRADQFPRMKKLDLAISAQNHLYLAGPSLVKMWGPKRAAWVTPVRAYLDAGLPTSLGTDASVVPYPPLWVFYHFVTRDTITGGVLGEDQKISREEALKGLTIANAWLTFEERTKGSIEVGKLADLVMLPEDLMTVEAKKVEQMPVLMTIVGGRIVYQQDGFQP